MRYTTLGTTEIKISRICMGCMGFGDPKLGHHSWTLNEEHTREIVRHGFEQGINFFDTAIAYQSGTSEQYVDAPFATSLAVRRSFLQRNSCPALLPRLTRRLQHRSISAECWTKACAIWAWTM